MLYANPLLVIAEFRDMTRYLLLNNADMDQKTRDSLALILSRYEAHNEALDKAVNEAALVKDIQVDLTCRAHDQLEGRSPGPVRSLPGERRRYRREGEAFARYASGTPTTTQ